MADILRPDLCIIGGGSGGLTVAASARAFGASVVLIEKGEMGGDCLNTGCVPSKALIAAAHHADAGRGGKPFGVAFGAPKVDFAQVHAHIHGVIAGIAPHDSVERFEALGVTVIKDHARFTDKRTVIAGETTIRARRFVVATGSRAAIPPIPGIENVPYLTNETVFSLKQRPTHLIVIGGGPIGMELAQAHCRLGAKVTVIEMADPLAKDDPELTEIALRRIRADGVDIRARTGVVAVTKAETGIAVTISTDEGEEEIVGSHLLVAAGRAANVEDMGLDDARIKHDRRGIKVNARLRSSNRRVYAIGDVAGGLQFTHVAGYHGAQVVRATLFGLPAPVKRAIIPWATYTDPEIANVGLTEAEASKKFGANFKVLRWSFAENDRARTERHTDGLVKMIVGRNGRIVGCGVVGAGAGELISLPAYAIANNMKIGTFLKYLPPYPTRAEVFKRAAVEYYRDALGNPWIARWLNFIRRLP